MACTLGCLKHFLARSPRCTYTHIKEIKKTQATVPELAAEVLRRHMRQLVMEEIFATVVGPEIALGALILLVVVDAVVFVSEDGVLAKVLN